MKEKQWSNLWGNLWAIALVGGLAWLWVLLSATPLG